MTDEPYRWVEAIGNRREYVEGQLASGSPVVALRYDEGLLLFTVARQRQKVFEIYDRIAFGGIGHPADIEKLRAAALEVASSEGFLRSVEDVSARRLVSYSLAPGVKSAFEQIFGAPYLARCLFVELGRSGHPDLAATLDYDGSFRITASALDTPLAAAIGGKKAAQEAMEKRMEGWRAEGLRGALGRALEVWADGMAAVEVGEDSTGTSRAAELFDEHRGGASVEAAVLCGPDDRRVCFRRLTADECCV